MSILSDLNSLVLRDTANPPLTNKGSALDFSEADGNIVKIFNAIQDIVSGANVPAYDNAKTYDFYSTDAAEKFASYDSKIWSAVYVGSPSSFSGQTPAESSYWTQVTLAQMLGNPIALTKIAEQFDDSQTSSPLYETAWFSSTSKTLNATPVDVTGLEAQGATKVLVPRFLVFALDAGAAVFNFPVGGVNLVFNGFTDTIVNITQAAINSATDVYAVFKVQETSKLKLNTKMQLYSASDATTGSGTYYVKVIYSIETTPF